MKTRNIGGSILPSSDPRILSPMSFNGRALLVVQDHKADTHHLTLDGKTIASHPNGYSCHALGERMIKGEPKRVFEQAKYIVDCGGNVETAALAKALGR